MKYIKTFSNTILSTTGLAILLASGVTGCQDQNQEQENSSEENQKKWRICHNRRDRKRQIQNKR